MVEILALLEIWHSLRRDENVLFRETPIRKFWTDTELGQSPIVLFAKIGKPVYWRNAQGEPKFNHSQVCPEHAGKHADRRTQPSALKTSYGGHAPQQVINKLRPKHPSNTVVFISSPNASSWMLLSTIAFA